ncbi:MAG: hypothetical protein EA339_13520 [Rhodobacteraceae bacterium]|nr:MAG: hypothetical protein EA339_13520 [Paracoccaceae bacterium]
MMTVMSRFVHHIALFVAALSLALASVGHATARHQAPGAVSMVICTGYGLVRITLDADGNPVEQSLPCPDCVMSQAMLVPEGITPPAPQTLATALRALSPGIPQPRAAGHWHQSRAPPLLG